ncbi:DUF3667 domain-containing protein [Yunchengibacter salinarum]|uniref:DUF3667 domain-containing protein n=1 Tax=Yunchengibacter salinarum TaxID=3133399 RepID=UPI0035B67127
MTTQGETDQGQAEVGPRGNQAGAAADRGHFPAFRRFLGRLRWHRQAPPRDNSAERRGTVSAHAHATCMNCGAGLTGGFCHMCGQRDRDLRRPLWTFLEEMIDPIFSADSRITRTIFRLIFLPGTLTRDYMAGRRARYVTPFKMYVATTFLFFITLSLANIALVDLRAIPRDAETGEQSAAGAADAAEVQGNGLPADAAAMLNSLPDGVLDAMTVRDDSGRQIPLRQALADPGFTLNADQRRKIERLLEKIKGKDRPNIVQLGGAPVSDGYVTVNLDELPFRLELGAFTPITDRERFQVAEADVASALQAESGDTRTERRLSRGLARVANDPTAFNGMFNDLLPKALIILMPVFAAFLWLFHWGRSRHYLHQLVFALHFHSFLFVLLTVMVLLAPYVAGPVLAWIFWIGSSLYLIVALWLGQDQGVIRAFIKAGLIYSIYFLMLSLALGIILYEGLTAA